MWQQIIRGFTEGLVAPITALLTKKEEVKLEKYRVDGNYDVEALKRDLEATKVFVELQKTNREDPTIRWGRLLFIIPTGIWYSAIVWYCILRKPFLDDSWQVLALPPNLEYIPLAVIALLFGYAVFKRK